MSENWHKNPRGYGITVISRGRVRDDKKHYYIKCKTCGIKIDSYYCKPRIYCSKKCRGIGQRNNETHKSG